MIAKNSAVSMEVSGETARVLFEVSHDERLWGALYEFLAHRRELARNQMERAETESEWRESKGAAKLVAAMLQLPAISADWRKKIQPDIGPDESGS